MEVISISSSQFSNHVTTHLYNYQESHIPYKPNHHLKYYNAIFLSTVKQNGRTNYSPRALIFDAKNGFGALNKYEYYEAVPDPLSLGAEIITTMNNVPKNDYQIGLDQGKNKLGLLNTDNTKYWTDFNKLIHKSNNLTSLNGWQLDDNHTVSNRFTPNLNFHKFDIGVNEFKLLQDDVIENYRKLLEASDFYQGSQFFTELDNSWSGFTNEMLTSIKDEFFNYTSNNKFNMWTFAYLSPKLNIDQRMTRIKSLVELSKNSSLLFPITMANDEPSYWKSSSEVSVIINSIWEVLNDKTTNMKDFESGILNNDNRNIVNSINLTTMPKFEKLDLYASDNGSIINYGFNNNSNHKFSFSEIVNHNDIDDNKTKNSKDNNHDKNPHKSYKADIMAITKIDTFPAYKYDVEKIDFSIDSAIIYDIKKYIQAVERWHTDDKDDLLQDLHDLKRSYYDAPEFEYDSDSD